MVGRAGHADTQPHHTRRRVGPSLRKESRVRHVQALVIEGPPAEREAGGPVEAVGVAGERRHRTGPRVHLHDRVGADDGAADDRGVEVAVHVGGNAVDDLERIAPAATLTLPGRPSGLIAIRTIWFCSVTAT